MDYRNNSIPADKITSTDVNKTIQRSLTKAVARHGLGLYIYAGEDLPEDLRSEDEKAFDKKVEDDKKAIISKKDQAILENMVKSKGYAVNEIFPKGLAITGEQYTQALETLKTLKKKGE